MHSTRTSILLCNFRRSYSAISISASTIFLIDIENSHKATMLPIALLAPTHLPAALIWFSKNIAARTTPRTTSTLPIELQNSPPVSSLRASIAYMTDVITAAKPIIRPASANSSALFVSLFIAVMTTIKPAKAPTATAKAIDAALSCSAGVLARRYNDPARIPIAIAYSITIFALTLPLNALRTPLIASGM